MRVARFGFCINRWLTLYDSVDVSLVSSIGQTFSQIGHADLTKGE
jgi:hypothetical protein